jgi:hypothetical protein
MEGPVTVPTTLIVVWAFDKGEDGELAPAFEPREMMSEDRAIGHARLLATQHGAVIAWSRSARPDTGEFGEPKVLFQHGDVPELE